jgi:hypothetical protein
MARINKTNTKKLAVAYSAYNKAVADEKWVSVKIWGKMLIEAQAATGVELLKESTIRNLMRR